MKNFPLIIGGTAVVVALLAFFGGATYQKHSDSLASVAPQDLPAKLQSLGLAAGGGQGAGFARGAGGGRRTGGGLATGEVLSKDDKSLTLKLQDGSTRIVYFSAATTVGTTTPGTLQDLAVGKQVVASGTANTDGSITAQGLQVRPAK